MAKATVEVLPEAVVDLTEAPIHVLHVDDEAGFLKAAKQILEMQGSIEVETAASVEEAQEKMRKKEFDVIVSDYIMPGKDGLEFLKELRDSRNSIPFIIFTGKGREIVAIKALNLGADQYVNKIGKPEAVYSELAHGIRTVVKGKKAEEKYRSLFENARDVILTFDLKGNVTSINKAAEEYGFKKDKIIGKNMCKFVHKKYWPKLLKDRVQLARGNPVEREIEINTPKGKKIADYRSNPIRLGEKVVGFQSVLRDVTERKEVKERIRASEEKYRSLVELAPDGIMTFDMKGVVTSINTAAARMSGYSKDEFVGKHFTKIGPIRARDIPKYLKMLPSTVRGKVPKPFEVTYRRKDGTTAFSEVRFSLMREKDKIVGIQAIIRDSSERKRMENVLRESEEKYRTQFEEALDAIFLADAETGILIDCNRAATKLFGRNKAELVGKHQRILHPPEKIDGGFSRTFEQHLKEKEGQVLETQVITKTGEIRDVVIKANMFELGDKRFLQGTFRDITEQKKAEEALRESEEKYRELLNGMNDTAWVIDFDGNIMDVNDSAVEVLGYSREEFRSIGLTGIDSNLDPKEINGLVEGMLSDEIQVFETVHTTKDGKKIPVEISSSLVTYRGKQAILSIARNITERKRAEEKLRQSEERYRTVFENTGTAMCILEEDKTISMLNKRFEELSGYSWKELEGKKWTEFVTKDSLERMKRYHEARRKKGGKAPTHYPFDFVNKKRQIKNGMLTINLIHGTKKSVASILDITEQKKLNDELRMSEQRFRDLVEATTDWIWETDKNGVYVYVSPKVKELLGYEVSEVLGKIPFDFMSKEEAKRVYKNFREQIINKEPSFKLEKVSRHKDGHLVIAESSSIPIFDEKGQLTGYRGIDRDITERKEAEEKLDEMMNELVTINEKLGVVGRLTRHDARNKLSVIANNVYLAKQKLATNHSSLEYLGDIESAVDQMEEIFDFARTYEMLGVEELSYMNVEKSVDEATMLFSGLDGAKLVNEFQGLTVLADSLLRQLFYNLIDDTLKHGETVSQIRVYYKEVGEDQLKLVYEDDGVGIPEDEKEKIFGEGYGKGTGYGLYLIKKICEAYGWTIQETGKPGKGAQFTMTMPKTNLKGKIAYQLQ